MKTSENLSALSTVSEDVRSLDMNIFERNGLKQAVKHFDV